MGSLLSRVRKTISPPKASTVFLVEEHKNNLSFIKQLLHQIIQGLRYNPTEESQSVDLSSFSSLLEHWEISQKDLPKVVRNLHLHLFLQGLFFVCFGIVPIVLFCLDLFHPSILKIILFSLLSSQGVVGVFYSAHRLSVLKNQKFKTFMQWITRG